VSAEPRRAPDDDADDLTDAALDRAVAILLQAVPPMAPELGRGTRDEAAS
jgi:hypothetical protein